MFSKKLLVSLVVLGTLSSVNAALQDKIAANSAKIDVLKKDIKEGKYVDANKQCNNCCNKCNKCSTR